MKHTSVKLQSPIEFINITPYNPLISECEIKVCYVGEQPNRNLSIITKETATKIANSLPGSPIVAFWNEEIQDFDGHKRELSLDDNGNIIQKDLTKPIGFVDLNAKVWFAKYLDDNSVEREYLMTKGWIWTGRFPETKRIIQQGNNQSMELDDKNIDAYWSKDNNGNPQFFIINEAIIKGLCVLGEDVEPCFEGATIQAPTVQFSFDESFKEQLFSMMNELTKILNKEEQKVFAKYPMTIGDTLWTALYTHFNNAYNIMGAYEDGEQRFVVLKAEDKDYRIDFSLAEDGSINFAEEVVLFEDDYEPQFTIEENNQYTLGKNEQEKNNGNQEPIEEPQKYSLDEIPEYVELMKNYNQLQISFKALQNSLNEAKETIKELTEYKNSVSKKEKQAMIDSFYMLSDEDKADVIENIDKYSIDDIEAKLSIICVRNKVAFNKKEEEKPITYSFNDDNDDKVVPAWVKSIRATVESMD